MATPTESSAARNKFAASASSPSKSIYVSAVDAFNVVNIEFMDGTALTVEMSPAIKLKVEYNDSTVAEGELLKGWPLLITR